MTTGGVSPHIPRMFIKGVRAMVAPSPRNTRPKMEEFSSNASRFASHQLSKFLASRMPLRWFLPGTLKSGLTVLANLITVANLVDLGNKKA